jgi:6-phosphogluconolactonase
MNRKPSLRFTQLIVTSTGERLRLDEAAGSDVEGFSVDRSGALTPIAGSPFPASGASLVSNAVIDSSDHFLYVGGLNSAYTGMVWGFSLDSSTGALTPFSGSPQMLPSIPSGLATSP